MRRVVNIEGKSKVKKEQVVKVKRLKEYGATEVDTMMALKLLKIGAYIPALKTRIKITLPSSYLRLAVFPLNERLVNGI